MEENEIYAVGYRGQVPAPEQKPDKGGRYFCAA